MRSRASSLPRAWWRWVYRSPPPARACAWAPSSSAIRSSIAVRLSANTFPCGSTVLCSTGIQESLRDDLVHDLRRPAADAHDAGVAIMTLHFGVAQVAHAAVELDGRVHRRVARLYRGVLRHRDFGRRDDVVANQAFRERPHVGAGDGGHTSQVGQPVAHHLTVNQWLAEGDPLPTPVDGQVQAALSDRAGLDRHADPLRGEVAHDL